MEESDELIYFTPADQEITSEQTGLVMVRVYIFGRSCDKINLACFEDF
jgi:hypothetical protein